MTPNRIVILVSPLFVGLAGWVVAWIAQHFPGHPHLDAAEVTAVFIAGATLAAGKVALWLRGWQKHEAVRLSVISTSGSPGVTWQFPAGASAVVADPTPEVKPTAARKRASGGRAR
jgi:hypothetical protein